MTIKSQYIHNIHLSSQSKIKCTLVIINIRFTCIPSFSFKISSHSAVFLLSVSPNVCISAFGYESEAHFKRSFPVIYSFIKIQILKWECLFLFCPHSFTCFSFASGNSPGSISLAVCTVAVAVDPLHLAFGALILWTASHHCYNNAY